MNVGFTGTKRDFNLIQESRFKELIKANLSIREFHHGDCVGADLHAHNIIKYVFPSIKIHVHPPISNTRRAFTIGNVEYKPEHYLERNYSIIKAVHFLIAAPLTNHEVLRSGTWATIRYAIKERRLVYILYPNGVVEVKNKR